MDYILVVLVTNVLQNLGVCQQRRMPKQRERLGIRPRIVDGDFEFQVSEIGPPVALDHVQFLGMRMTGEVKPEFIVEADRVYHQRVALPLAGRVPVPGWIGVLRMAASVQKDLPVRMDVALEKKVC